MQCSHLSAQVAKVPGSSVADRGNLPGKSHTPLNHNLNVWGGLPLRSVIVAVASLR